MPVVWPPSTHPWHMGAYWANALSRGPLAQHPLDPRQRRGLAARGAGSGWRPRSRFALDQLGTPRRSLERVWPELGHAPDEAIAEVEERDGAIDTCPISHGNVARCSNLIGDQAVHGEPPRTRCWILSIHHAEVCSPTDALA